MGAQGTATLDFGEFPGSSVATVDVAAAGVVVGSAIEAWINPTASVDHTDTDHIAAAMRVVGTYLTDDNIRIYGLNANDVMPPEETTSSSITDKGLVRNPSRQAAPMFVGQFNVSWVWN